MADKLEDVLGLPQECGDFTDGKVRVAYPVTMKNFPTFISNLGYVNPKNLWNNMVFDEGINAVKAVLTASFKDDDIDEIMENINARNFPQIMNTIMRINGINLDRSEDSDPKNEMEV